MSRDKQILAEMTSESYRQAMVDGFRTMVRKRLRDMVLDTIEPDVDAIVEKALKDFEGDIRTYLTHNSLLPTLNIVVDYKSKRTV